ncbi:uncharacterized protein LOC135220208 isoform X2 [Macrobrachium nipponense]|uniref:uncharacterized protein LOC135220208 isoform X2 n=1 Tax=Macrobrachium nipponense TaxID=159736 RepID=UPI0030C8B374
MGIKIYVLIVTLHAIAANGNVPSRTSPKQATPLPSEPLVLHLVPSSLAPPLPFRQSEGQPPPLNLHSFGSSSSASEVTGPLIKSFGAATPNSATYSSPSSTTQTILLPPTLQQPGPIKFSPVFADVQSPAQKEKRFLSLGNTLIPLLQPFNSGPGGPLSLIHIPIPALVHHPGNPVSISFPTTGLTNSIVSAFGSKFPFLGITSKKDGFRSSHDQPSLALTSPSGVSSSAHSPMFMPLAAPVPSPTNNIFPEPHYDFGYIVNDEHSRNNFAHQETRRGQDTLGYYEVLLPDGRLQRG